MRRRNSRGIYALAICGVLAAACKKSAAPPVPALAPTAALGAPKSAAAVPAPIMSEAERIAQIKSDPRLSAAGKEILIAHVPEDFAADKQELLDRQELVLPAPPNWRPEDARRKLKLTLIPEKSTIHVGERFRYRVETQNVGREPVTFVESSPGFIKDGQLSDHWYGFYAAPPGGKERRLMIPFIRPSSGLVRIQEYFPAGKTQAERDASFARMKIEHQAAANLSLSLRSGETLMTRPDSMADKFRNLKANFSFVKPGTYRVKAVYDDRPLPPPTEEHIRSMMRQGYSREHQMKRYEEEARDNLGLVESNAVLLKVIP